MSRRNVSRIGERIQAWRGLGAAAWECWKCHRTLGFVLPGRFFSFHAEREIEVNAPRGLVIRQVCNHCGVENTFACTDIDTTPIVQSLTEARAPA